MASFTKHPVFTLFRVKPTEIHRKYLSGYFVSAKLPPLSQKVVHAKESFKELTTENFTNPIFSDVGIGKRQIPDIFATTNCHQYQVLYNSGKIPVGGRCWHCRNDFTTESIGIPFHVETFYDEDSKSTIVGFHTDGIFHDFRCALKFLRTQPGYKPGLETETNLFIMFRYMYPTAPPLQEANDFRLLDINGGPLPWEKWCEVSYIYVETPRIIMLPFKRAFQQKKVHIA